MRIIPRSSAISDYCKAEDISRNEAARRIGVSVATAYRIDEGMVEPSPKFIAGLIIATGKSFDELFEIVEDEAIPA